MNKKVFYILLIVCCMSLFSSARPNGKECNCNTCCRYSKSLCAKGGLGAKAVKEEADVDLPPLKLISFDL